MVPNWKFLTFLTAAILLAAALLATVYMSPISELHISIQNMDEYETVHLILYLDDSPQSSLYAGPGGFVSWIFHVSPGNHEVGIDYLFNYSYENEHDQIVDFTWDVDVGFDGLAFCVLTVDEDGFAPHLGDFIFETTPPIIQALHDPYVMVPAITFVVLNIVLVVAMWCYCDDRRKAI